MSYSTPAMVRQALVPSSDGSTPNTPTNTAADLSDVQLQDAINEADAMIDGYIGRFYATPVAEVVVSGEIPHPIDYWSRNIASYNATLAYRKSQDFADTDPVARRYVATMDALKAVAAGTVGLNLPDNRSTSGATGAGPAINPYRGDLWTTDDFSLNPGWQGGPFRNGHW